MSIALDVGLFFRNSKTKLGMSLSARAIIFTLAFRVGTKSSTWISPDSLAEECGLHRQNIFDPLAKIVSTGIVLKKSSPRNKKKQIYSFSDLIKNYHQASDEQKKKIHEALGDEYKPPVDKSKRLSGKPDCNSSTLSGKPDYTQSGKPDYRPDEKTAGSPATSGLREIEKTPKGTYESNIRAFKGKTTKAKAVDNHEKLEDQKTQNKVKHPFASMMNEKAHVEKYAESKQDELNRRRHMTTTPASGMIAPSGLTGDPDEINW